MGERRPKKCSRFARPVERATLWAVIRPCTANMRKKLRNAVKAVAGVLVTTRDDGTEEYRIPVPAHRSRSDVEDTLRRHGMTTGVYHRPGWTVAPAAGGAVGADIDRAKRAPAAAQRKVVRQTVSAGMPALLLYSLFGEDYWTAVTALPPVDDPWAIPSDWPGTPQQWDALQKRWPDLPSVWHSVRAGTVRESILHAWADEVCNGQRHVAADAVDDDGRPCGPDGSRRSHGKSGALKPPQQPSKPKAASAADPAALLTRETEASTMAHMQAFASVRYEQTDGRSQPTDKPQPTPVGSGEKPQALRPLLDDRFHGAAAGRRLLRRKFLRFSLA